MVSMILAAITMLLLSWGAITEVRFALGFGIFLLALCMLLEFIGAIVILVYGVEESDVLTSDLKEVFFKLIYRMDYDSRANRILKIVQEYVNKIIQKIFKLKGDKKLFFEGEMLWCKWQRRLHNST